VVRRCALRISPRQAGEGEGAADKWPKEPADIEYNCLPL